jgi:MraZ protein
VVVCGRKWETNGAEITPVFYGEYEHSLDEKGRLTIPSRVREAMKQGGVTGFMVTRGLDECLFLFPLQQWQTYVEKLGSLPLEKGNARRFTRMFYSGASECSPDRQGRVFIPPNLREHAHIEKDVVIIGVQNRLELWDKARWEAFSTESKESYEETAEELW